MSALFSDSFRGSLLSSSSQTGGSTAPPVTPRMDSGSTWPRSPPARRGCCGCSSTVSFTSCGWRCSSCVSSTRFGFQTRQSPFGFPRGRLTLFFSPLFRSQLWESPQMRGWTPGDTSTLKLQPRQSKVPSSKRFFSCCHHLNIFNSSFRKKKKKSSLEAIDINLICLFILSLSPSPLLQPRLFQEPCRLLRDPLLRPVPARDSRLDHAVHNRIRPDVRLGLPAGVEEELPLPPPPSPPPPTAHPSSYRSERFYPPRSASSYPSHFRTILPPLIKRF